jgi:hypothetical protein
MKTEEVLSVLEVPFTFSRRPVAIPGDMRPLWRIALIALFLNISSRGAKSSLTRLHALNWLSKKQASQDQLISLLDKKYLSETIIVRYEPSFNRALDLAIGERLIARLDGKNFSLTPKGRAFAKAIESEDDCLSPEKAFLSKIGKRFTEEMSSTLTERGISS